MMTIDPALLILIGLGGLVLVGYALRQTFRRPALPLRKQGWKLQGRGTVIVDTVDKHHNEITVWLKDSNDIWSSKNSITYDLDQFMHYAEVDADATFFVTVDKPNDDDDDPDPEEDPPEDPKAEDPIPEEPAPEPTVPAVPLNSPNAPTPE